MKNKPQEQMEMETSMFSTLGKLREKLSDSPVSLGLQKEHMIGFYHGFCQGKNWEADLDFLSKLEKF